MNEKQNYLHEYTYDELLAVETPVIDTAGILWCGPSRRGMNAPNPMDLWRKWRREVERVEPRFLRPEVISYHHQTKDFGRPPRANDIVQVEVPKPVKPVLTWSPTKLQTFETCPMQFAAKYVHKTVPYEETEATRWGNRLHSAAEVFLKNQPCTDPEALKLIQKWVTAVSRVPGQRFVEEKISVDEKLQPCAYSEGVGRMIADVYVKHDDILYIYDWKTGKVKDDHFQLKTYALLLAIKYPDVQRVIYKYIWLKEDEITGGELERTDLVPVAKDLLARLARLKQAYEADTWQPTKNGLCRNWCNVTECIHCGR